MAGSACSICDTFWRLYAHAVENLHELVRKHRDVYDRGDKNSMEMLDYEIAIAESTLHSIRQERLRHDQLRHCPPMQLKEPLRSPKSPGSEQGGEAQHGGSR